MPEKEQGRPTRGSRSNPTTPEDFPTTPQQTYPSGDYSYTVELVGTMRHSLGQLTEAVQGLKEQSKEQGKELKEIGKDLHAAKVVVSVVGGLIILVGSAIAWLVNTYISTHPVK